MSIAGQSQSELSTSAGPQISWDPVVGAFNAANRAHFKNITIGSP